MTKTYFEKMYKRNFVVTISILGFLWGCNLPLALSKPHSSSKQQQSRMSADAMFNYDDCDFQASQDYPEAGLISDYSELDKDNSWQRQSVDVAAADALLAAESGPQGQKSSNFRPAFAAPQLDDENDESMNEINFGFEDAEEPVIERSKVKQQEHQHKRAQPAKDRGGFMGRQHRQNHHQKKHELNENDFGMEDEDEDVDEQPQ